MKRSAPAPDTGSKTHDGIAMDAGQPLGCPDGTTFSQSADDLNLLVTGEDIHRANPWFGDWPAQTFKKVLESAIFFEAVIA